MIEFFGIYARYHSRATHKIRLLHKKARLEPCFFAFYLVEPIQKT